MRTGSLYRTIFTLAIVVLLVWVFSNKLFDRVPTGHHGVLNSNFTGLSKTRVYEPGLRMILPWTNIICIDTRKQGDNLIVNANTKNGLSVKCNINVQFRPIPEKLPQLLAGLNADYKNLFVKPEARGAVSSIISRYTADELYSTNKEALQKQMMDLLGPALKEHFIMVDKVIIQEITLPKSISDAIEQKLQQEQESQEYEFKLKKAELEAQRLLIEAEGLAAYNKSLSANLTDNVLKFKGIEATLELAKSLNTKIIVIGDKDGLPVILND
jgi:regulator of protease activity HflC (stomatin/prohibitin superfamily)